jgi:hypothetical protein
MGGWIPPLPLAIGAVCFGLSWIVLFSAGRADAFGASFPALGWVHLVALGWITTIALSVLQHVIPAFLDVDWRGRYVARWATLVFAAGALVLTFGFLTTQPGAVQIGGTLAFLALLAYALSCIAPLAAAMRVDATTRAIARAFSITLLLLLATGFLGAYFASVLAGHGPANALLRLPQSHALLGIGGWLTLLIVGVSARTMGPIAGVRSRFKLLHVVSGSAIFIGVVIGAFSTAFGARPWTLAAFAFVALGIAAYAADIGDILARATVRHRPPQALMACAVAGAIGAVFLFGGAALGRPWGAAAVYAALIGWIGNAVLAHMHHIGVRVLLTQTRGEDDETRPGDVLFAPLSWTTTIAYEAAAVLGAFGIATGTAAFVQAAAVAGLAAFVSLAANLMRARSIARALPIDLAQPSS